EVFSTVCLDACYYTFPSEKWLEGLAKQVPAGFKFGFKVTGEITLAHFPNLRRFGKRAGSRNAHFLNAELFAREFITPCEAIREKVGVIIFEFSHFHESDYQRGRDFLPHLDTFLSRVPKGW